MIDFRKNNFDLIRLLAAVQVVYIHGVEHFGLNDFSNGFLGIFPGVPIFFVLSGFLVSASLERSSSLTSYLIKRFLRIYPALWLCFAVSIVSVLLFYDDFVFSAEPFLLWIIAQISVFQFYNPDFLRGYGIGVLNGSLWTIPIELQFYILLPILYWVFKKIRWSKFILGSIFIIFVLLSLLYSLVKQDESIWVKLFGITAFPYLYLFMIGIFLQRNFDLIKPILGNRALIVFIAYLLINFITYKVGWISSGNLLNPISSVMLALLVISFAYSFPSLNNILKGVDISYGIYIYHMVFVNLFIVLGYKNQKGFISLFLIIFLFSSISWFFIEKPALRLKKFLVQK